MAVSTQPAFIYHSGDRYLESVPESRRQHLYPISTMMEKGLLVAFGSDAPIAAPDPLVGVRAAVDRTSAKGRTLLAEEEIDVIDALRMHTQDAARAAFEEERKGSVTPGKLADLVVLDLDPREPGPAVLKDLKVEMTIVGGEVVWERPGSREKTKRNPSLLGNDGRIEDNPVVPVLVHLAFLFKELEKGEGLPRGKELLEKGQGAPSFAAHDAPRDLRRYFVGIPRAVRHRPEDLPGPSAMVLHKLVDPLPAIPQYRAMTRQHDLRVEPGKSLEAVQVALQRVLRIRPELDCGSHVSQHMISREEDALVGIVEAHVAHAVTGRAEAREPVWADIDPVTVLHETEGPDIARPILGSRTGRDDAREVPLGEARDREKGSDILEDAAGCHSVHEVCLCPVDVDDRLLREEAGEETEVVSMMVRHEEVGFREVDTKAGERPPHRLHALRAVHSRVDDERPFLTEDRIGIHRMEERYGEGNLYPVYLRRNFFDHRLTFCSCRMTPLSAYLCISSPRSPGPGGARSHCPRRGKGRPSIPSV